MPGKGGADMRREDASGFRVVLRVSLLCASFVPSCALIASGSVGFCLLKSWPGSAAVDVVWSPDAETGLCSRLGMEGHREPCFQAGALPPHRPLLPWVPSYCSSCSLQSHSVAVLTIVRLTVYRNTAEDEMGWRKPPSSLLPAQAAPLQHRCDCSLGINTILFLYLAPRPQMFPVRVVTGLCGDLGCAGLPRWHRRVLY